MELLHGNVIFLVYAKLVLDNGRFSFILLLINNRIWFLSAIVNWLNVLPVAEALLIWLRDFLHFVVLCCFLSGFYQACILLPLCCLTVVVVAVAALL